MKRRNVHRFLRATTVGSLARSTVAPVVAMALVASQLQIGTPSAEALLTRPDPTERRETLAGRGSGRCPGKGCRLRTGPRQGVKCPKGSIKLTPRSNLQGEIDTRPPGTTFCLGRGVYRLRVPLRPKSGDAFVGEYGAVLTGARVVRNWARAGSLWVADGQTQENEVMEGVPCQEGVECNRPEGVFVDGRPLLQVPDVSVVRKRTFYFDYGTDRIYIANDPRGRRVEASVESGAFRSTDHYADGVTVRNLVIEKFANPSRTGAIWDTVSPGWVMANNEIAFNHGVGIAHSSSSSIRRNYIHHNGQLGLSGYQAVAVTVSRNEISRNAIGGFAGWEAGGAKYVQTTGLIVRGNHVHHNLHHGLWTNGDNVDTVYARNTVVANRGSGIFHEEAYGCLVRANYLADNGEHGLYISSSSNVEAVGNTVETNTLAGVQLFVDGATGYDLSNNVVHDNVFTMRNGSYNGLSTVRVPDPSIFSTSKGNRFQHNTYFVPNTNARYWFWNEGWKTWSEWRASGQDTTGRLFRRRDR